MNLGLLREAEDAEWWEKQKEGTRWEAIHLRVGTKECISHQIGSAVPKGQQRWSSEIEECIRNSHISLDRSWPLLLLGVAKHDLRDLMTL